jgi:uncharacterized lipoprotein YmbA
MTHRRIGARIGPAVGLMGTGVLLAGCLSPKEDPTRFYVLSTSEAAQVDEAWDNPPGSIDVGVGPFTIPGYLDRPQFVRRLGPNELLPVGAARWAETLSEGFERVLAEDLDALLPMARVHAHPWRSSTRAQWIITGYVTQFETDTDLAGARPGSRADPGWSSFRGACTRHGSVRRSRSRGDE